LSNVPVESALSDADAVVLVTAHPGIDHAAIAREAPLFIDLRGVTRGLHVQNLVRL
jgi:UDP-N-acetyl-D-glucosamine dehydrogenase